MQATLDELGPSPPWRVAGSARALDDPWLRVRVDRCVTDAGDEVSPYYVLEYPDWVHIVAIDEADRILVTRQYRHARQRAFVELPGGAVDPADASPMAAAQRELREETGHAGGEWCAAGRLAVNPATHTNLVHCFVVRGSSPVTAPKHSPSEQISSTFVTVNRLYELIDSGDFGQALHVATLFLALRRR